MDNKRFEVSRQGEQFESEYDIASDEIADIQNRGVAPVKIITPINLSIAGQISINESGYGFVLYVTDSNGADYPEGFSNVFINQQDASDPVANFPAKHNRGFIGSFTRLFLSWPGDVTAEYTATLVIFKSKNMPWIGGNEAT